MGCLRSDPSLFDKTEILFQESLAQGKTIML